MKSVPQVRPDLRLEDLGNELLVYDELHRQYHLLNSTARLVWQLCDGTRGLAEIAAEVAEHYPTIPDERIRADVETTLAAFGDKELIVWVTATAGDQD
jgi:hypothetical protein